MCLKPWAMVVAQLVERSLPKPEINSSNPNIGKILSRDSTLKRKYNNKEKEPGNGQLKNKHMLEALSFVD